MNKDTLQRLSQKDLEKLVSSGKASPDQIREFMTRRDLKDLPTEHDYLLESRYTAEWFCPEGCGGPIPCTIDCPQCGHKRPKANFDNEQGEGQLGSLRLKAGRRGK